MEMGKNKNNKYFYVFIMLKDVQDLLFYFFLLSEGPESNEESV